MQSGDLCLFPQFQTSRCSQSILMRIFSPSRSKKKGAWLLQQLQNSERTVFLAVLEAQQREAEGDNRYLLGRTEGAWTESPKLELPVGIEPFVLLPQAGALLARLELSGNIFKRNALDTSRADRLLCHRHKIYERCHRRPVSATRPDPLPACGEPELNHAPQFAAAR